MKYAAIYVRVSTAEQRDHGLSVDSQIDALVKYCEENNLQYRIYSDAGISAHISYRRRPAIVQLIKDCQNNEISIILFTRLDRWFRSVKDYYLVADQLKGVPWRAIWEDYETETASGQFKVNIMLSVSEAESARTSEKIKAVNEYRRQNGAFVGRACTGYKIVKTPERTTLIKDDKAPMVEALFRNYRNTLSIYRAANLTCEEGYPISQKLARGILHNPMYCGSYLGSTFEPFISRKEFDFNQDMIKKKTRTTDLRKKHHYMFVSLIRCKLCGATLFGAPPKRKESPMYRCQHRTYIGQNRQVSVRETDLENYLLSVLEPELNKVTVEAEMAAKKGKINRKRIISKEG